MELLNSIIGTINDYMYGYILVGLLVVVGIYFTLRTGFVQFRLFPDGLKQIMEKNENKSAMSSFQALMISTASRVGIGNIAGVATAISAGGPGAVFWMWLIAVLGSASAFVESTLAQVYKVKHGEEFRGGPSYYIQKALGQRWLGIIFSISLIACFAYGFNTLQANNIVSALSYYFGGEYPSIAIPAMIGLVLAGFTGYIIFKGQKYIAFISSILVPVMALFYMALGFYIIVKNIGILPATIAMIFKSAFDFESFSGGLMGSAILWGIKRGLFSNEAGMGSAPNAAAAAQVSHPAKQGLVQMISVFIDTLLICSTSAFIILLSGVDYTALKAMPLVQQAVSSQVGEWGITFITISVFLFAFSSIIGNYYYTESNVMFIQNRPDGSLTIFRITCIIAVFLGSIAGYDLAWNIADVLMGVMALINITAILLLGNTAVLVLKDYSDQRKAGKDPVFSAKAVGIKNTDVW
ncbi:alanine/glycine:cation symporter family protein [Proteocatella sphenisci]|uniref:alanine/glycine:cation symporter family protein n=1 Tax=Proteocatella sphenisci TaxID=181070 RepID=UPI000490ED03|nr:alanine/glycine:cation symporter family protein [Proteocatella sphenisci]